MSPVSISEVLDWLRAGAFLASGVADSLVWNGDDYALSGFAAVDRSGHPM